MQEKIIFDYFFGKVYSPIQRRRWRKKAITLYQFVPSNFSKRRN